MCGKDLYEPTGRCPLHLVNIITCHDGFTLWDLVSYNDKHNEATGEGLQPRRHGSRTFSWNCGVEGSSRDPEVDVKRATARPRT